MGPVDSLRNKGVRGRNERKKSRGCPTKCLISKKELLLTGHYWAHTVAKRIKKEVNLLLETNLL